jgi:hypothetical protein
MLTFLPEWRGLPPEEVFPYAYETTGETNAPDIRGRARRMPYPPEHLRPTDGEFDWTPSRDRETFFFWCNEQDVWTLAYSMGTFLAAMNLSLEFPAEWEKVKREIYPSQSNELLHIKHGTASGYTYGCHAPLCTAAMRRFMRKHRDQVVQVDPEGLEECLIQVGKSFQFYLEYIRVLRNYRILGDKHKRDDPLRWKAVDRRKTILMDCCDI